MTNRSAALTGAPLAAALTLALAVPALAATPSGSYSGETSQGLAAKGSVSHGKVKHLTIPWKASCSDGTGLQDLRGFRFNPIALKGRRFGIKGTNDGMLEGTTFVQNISVAGRFNKAGSKAKIVFTISTEFARSGKLVTCKSGKLRFAIKQ